MVIVAYRSRDLLDACLRSLREHPPSIPMRVIVVDNDSRDGTAEMVAAEHPDVDLVESASNLGFAAATNLGAARGRGDRACSSRAAGSRPSAAVPRRRRARAPSPASPFVTIR